MAERKDENKGKTASYFFLQNAACPVCKHGEINYFLHHAIFTTQLAKKNVSSAKEITKPYSRKTCLF